MTALIAAVGLKALAYAGTAIAGFIALFFVGRTIKNAGSAEQRAADAQKGVDDNAAATKARSGVDGLSDTAVNDKLCGYQRK